MKKIKFLTLCMFGALVFPTFAATISVIRTKPAELDLGKAKTISLNVITATGKKAVKWTKEQEALGDKFANRLIEYSKADGRFEVTKENPSADVQVNIVWNDFSVTDDGAQITQTLDDGTVNVIMDSFKRSASGKMEVTIIDAVGKKTLGSKKIDFFDGDLNEKPKADLKSPVEILLQQAESYPYQISVLLFDSLYQQPITIMDMKTKDKAIKEQLKNALKLLKKKDYEAAKAIYEEIYNATEDASVGYNYARTLQFLKNFDDAELLIQRFLEADPKNKTLKKALEDIATDRQENAIISAR